MKDNVSLVNENVGKWGRWQTSSGEPGRWHGIAEQSHKGVLTACNKGRGMPSRVAPGPYGETCATCMTFARLRGRYDKALDTAEAA